jgi:hypothetical protein
MTVSVARSGSRKLTEKQVVTIRAELASILASDSFSSSKRCRDFLEFVVERALAGDFDSLTERFLGVELFGRPVDYETATDSIVRVRANDVRRRLAQYYSARRSTPAGRIDLIAGGYVPEFHWSSDGVAIPAAPPELELSVPAHPEVGQHLLPPPERKPGDTKVKAWRYAPIALALLVAIVCAFVMRPARSNFDRFWGPVLEAPGSPVLNLPTTDTIQLTLDPARSLHGVTELKSGETLKLGPGDMIGFHDWHVSMPVLQATLSVSLALARKGKSPIVRIGTDIRRDEMRGHPIIAIGSFSNPWTEQNVSGLRFTFDRGSSDREPPRIRDAQNPNRSWSLPHIFPEPQTKDYAIVTRTFDPVTGEPFVSLAGLHSFGNQTAGEFVSQESSWNEVARRAPKGWETMNMQVLLETSLVGTTPGSPKIIDLYFWK